MKLNAEQLDFLRQYLGSNLKFRETYVEFYDHVLTALENKPEPIDFQQAVESVINRDFGGFEAVTGIEQSFKISATKEIQKKYAHYFMAFFKFPLVFATGFLAAAFYGLVLQQWFGLWPFMVIILGMRLASSALRGLRHIRSGYMFGNTKKSVKDGVFVWLDTIPAMAFFFVLITHALDTRSPLDWFKSINPAILALVLTCLALHNLAYYKIYKDEFKAILTT